MIKFKRRDFLKRISSAMIAICLTALGFSPMTVEAQSESTYHATQSSKIQIAASPINWSDDDFPILGEETSVITILQVMQAAGYRGTELGNKYPTDVATLKSLLENFDIELAAAWHCTYFLKNSFEHEKKEFAKFLDFLKEMGTKVAVVAECTFCPFKPDTTLALNQNFPALLENLFPYQLPKLNNSQWKKMGQGFSEFAKMADDAGIKMGYHPHMQTVVENLRQIKRLLKEAPNLHLTIDTGHLAFAGVNVYEFIHDYKDRAVHYHMKNIRPNIVERARKEPMSFEWAVINGCFAVPGDGGLDFARIFRQVISGGYQGWWVVEAEQNPLTSNPYLYARLARAFIQLEIDKIAPGY